MKAKKKNLSEFLEALELEALDSKKTVITAGGVAHSPNYEAKESHLLSKIFGTLVVFGLAGLEGYYLLKPKILSAVKDNGNYVVNGKNYTSSLGNLNEANSPFVKEKDGFFTKDETASTTSSLGDLSFSSPERPQRNDFLNGNWELVPQKGGKGEEELFYFKPETPGPHWGKGGLNDPSIFKFKKIGDEMVTLVCPLDLKYRKAKIDGTKVIYVYPIEKTRCKIPLNEFKKWAYGDIAVEQLPREYEKFT